MWTLGLPILFVLLVGAHPPNSEDYQKAAIVINKLKEAVIQKDVDRISSLLHTYFYFQKCDEMMRRDEFLHMMSTFHLDPSTNVEFKVLRADDDFQEIQLWMFKDGGKKKDVRSAYFRIYEGLIESGYTYGPLDCPDS